MEQLLVQRVVQPSFVWFCPESSDTRAALRELCLGERYVISGYFAHVVDVHGSAILQYMMISVNHSLAICSESPDQASKVSLFRDINTIWVSSMV